ncbi:MAG: OmpA family protein, partial [Flavobacteriales bacterium]|nr:OmpA family protein [Flavobacteriales bacterium]
VIDKDTEDDVKYVYNPNMTSGRYLMIFPPGKNYKMLVEAENYQPYEFNLMIPDQTYFYQLSQTITLEPKKIMKNKANGITVKNNFYDPSTGGNVIMATRDSILLSLIERIIQKTDSIALAGLTDMTYQGQDINEEKIRYEPLLDLIEEIINHEDVTTFNNLDLITTNGNIEEQDFKIYFESGGTELNPAALNEVNKVCTNLSSGNYSKLYIFGHSDNQGTLEKNMQLSKDRAYKVYEFLKECMDSKVKVTISKHGSHIPIASNADEKGRRLNRRVEIKLGN